MLISWHYRSWAFSLESQKVPLSYIHLWGLALTLEIIRKKVITSFLYPSHFDIWSQLLYTPWILSLLS